MPLLYPPGVSLVNTAISTVLLQQNKNPHHFFLPPFFSIKETKIFLFCLSANAGIAETLSHPQPAFGGQSKQAKIPSPDPLPFCLLAWRTTKIFQETGLLKPITLSTLKLKFLFLLNFFETIPSLFVLRDIHQGPLCFRPNSRIQNQKPCQFLLQKIFCKLFLDSPERKGFWL